MHKQIYGRRSGDDNRTLAGFEKRFKGREMKFFTSETRLRFRCDCGQAETIKIANMPHTPGGQFMISYNSVQCPRCLNVVIGTVRDEDAEYETE